MPPRGHDVLIIESSAERAAKLSAHLSGEAEHRWRSAHAPSLSEAIELVKARSFDVVLIPTTIADSTWDGALARLRDEAPEIAAVVISDDPGPDVALEAVRQGAQDCVAAAELRRGELGLKLALASERQKLAVASAHAAAIVEHSDDAIFSVAPDMTVLSWNDGAERMYGYTAAEVRGRSMQMIIPDDKADDVAKVREHLERGVAIRSWDTVRVARDGRRLDVSITVSPLGPAGSAGRLPAAAVVSRDIGERKRAERSLQESERHYRVLFEDNPHPMWVYEGGSLRFLAVNDAALRQYGYAREEFLAMTLRDIRPPEELPALDGQVASRRREGGRHGFKLARTWKHRRKDGTLLDIEISVSPIRFLDHADAWLALALDVTERKRLEAQFFHSQKLESVGRLAGAVAHDFNNLLGVVTGYGDMMARQLPPDHPLAPKVAEILKAAARAADLTKQLLAFSRKQVMEPRVLSLDAIVDDHADMFRRLLGPDVELVISHGKDAGRVKADAGQMSQVLVNLVVNAADAMPEGGRLIIETGTIDVDESYADRRPEVKPGPYVSLTVSDTGVGMSAETLGQIFEPFFTTKEEGRGTGLGLSTVYGIVKQSGGHVWTYSEPGKGTTLRIHLPRVDEAGEPRPAAPAPQPAADRGHERILVVEDNEALRTIIGELLAEAGYDVIAAANGAEALHAVEGLQKPVDLVISDVVMPVMGGAALVKRLHPVRFLFMSGYSELVVEKRLTGNVAFLQKPFAPGALLGKVREVLDDR